MSEQTPSTPAGWYPDPQSPGQQRYWDGTAWAAAAPPPPAAVPPAPAPGAIPETSTNAIVGLVLAIVSWFLCPVIAAIAALIVARSSDKEIAASSGRVGGSGLNTATRIIAWINIAVAVLAGIVIAILAILGVGLFAGVAASLDPAINTRTGLADGQYIMSPERRVSLNEECSYGGPVASMEGGLAGDVTVYGVGPVQCPDLVQANSVLFEVRGGTATIVRVD